MSTPLSDLTTGLPLHPVRVVAQRTGLSSHVLRAWERRYGVVAPVRTEGGQRLYTDRDIDRLALLRALTDGGYSIGQLALLPWEELQRLSEAEPAVAVGSELGSPAGDGAAAAARGGAFRAIEAFDAPGFKRVLESAAVALGASRFMEEVLAPVLVEIGRRWGDGRMSIAHEHLATAVMRRVLGWVIETAERGEAGPMLVVATPPRQVHEGGALLVAATAAVAGWRVTYLGADLPPEEIADAARTTGARAVGLSLLHPDNDRGVAADLRALRQALPAGVALLVGGAAATAYAEGVAAAEGELVTDLPSLRQALRSLAAPALAQT